MSYSSRLKDVMLDSEINEKSEILAELSGIFSSKDYMNQKTFDISSENLGLIKRVSSHLEKISKVDKQLKYTIARRFSKPMVYTISISKNAEYFKLMKEIEEIKKSKKDNDKVNILRGYFLNTGYIKDPTKSYTLDFFIDTKEGADFLYDLILSLEKKVFKTEKKNKYIVYIRNSEDILDFINMFGCIDILFEYEDVIIRKELNNKTNRSLNYELANETKRFTASLKQMEIIEYIDNKMGINNLTNALSELALLRLENEDDSFQELAEKLNISKSGVRNRFRRLEQIYLELKGN